MSLAPPVGRALALLACLALTGCGGSTYTWGWHVIDPRTAAGNVNLGFLLGGMKLTLAISVLAFLLALMLGLLVSIPLLSANRWARGFARSYVELLRAIPSLVMLLWVYYGLPVVLGISLDAFSAAVIGLALGESAFMAEIFRAGVQSIDRGQFEAADAVGLDGRDKFRFVVLPQAVRRILPPLGNQFVYTLKMSALASMIGVQELVRRSNELVVNAYRPLEIYTFLVLEYLVLVVVAAAVVRWLERHYGSDERLRR